LFNRRSTSSQGDATSGDSGGAPGQRTRTMQLQRRSSGPASSTVPTALPTGGGAPLASPVQAQMEDAFGVHLDAVRVHETPAVNDLGAIAAAQGTDLHFAPGQYQPDTKAGRELIGHEVTHVVQQAQGRVAAPAQAKGAAVNADPALEREADELGARAAAGERVSVGAAAVGAGTGAVQLQAGPTRADATSRGDDRDERSERGRPERPAESGSFGAPYDNFAEAAAAEAYLRATLIPSSLGMFGAEVANLWSQFLSREPGASLAPVPFRENASGVAFAFKHCEQIARAQNDLLDEVVGNLGAAGTLPPGRWTTVPLANFFPVPRDLSINFSNPYDTPGHIAGGQSGSDAGADTRSVQDGSVRIMRQTDQTGATTHALIEPNFHFRVFDAIDFIPGGAGAGIEQVFTIPLSRLEASGWAYDVPFEVTFTGPVTQRNVPGSALSGNHPTNPDDATRQERQRDPAAPEEREPSRSRLGEREDTRRRDL
jgi:hypothetical protein